MDGAHHAHGARTQSIFINDLEATSKSPAGKMQG